MLTDSRGARSAAVASVLLALTLAGCSAAGLTAEEADEPFSLATVGEHTRLDVDPEAIEWLGVRTEPVAAGDPASGGLPTVPIGAVLYAPDGSTFLYAHTEEHSYDRRPVTVDRIDGDRAALRDAPPPGTPVVTQGAAELTGMEFGLEDE